MHTKEQEPETLCSIQLRGQATVYFDTYTEAKQYLEAARRNAAGVGYPAEKKGK